MIELDTFKVIAMLKEAFNKFYDDENKLMIILRSTFSTLVEHAMMIEMPNGTTCRLIFEFFELVFNCPLYKIESSSIR